MLTRPAFARRRGAVVPLAAIMSVFLILMVAFVVDIGAILSAQAEAQSTADAAALAGVSKLMAGLKNATVVDGKLVQTNSQIIAAKEAAIAIAGKNHIANKAAVLKDNSTEIVVGFLLDPASTAAPGTPPAGLPCNAMKVTVFRDSDHGGEMSLFFAKIIGMASAKVSATATAMVHVGKPTIKSTTGGLLPFAYPVAEYNALIMAGTVPTSVTVTQEFQVKGGGNEKTIETKEVTVTFTDSKSVDATKFTSSSVTNGSDQILEAHFYPSGTGAPGNYGTINFFLSSNGNASNSTKVSNEIMIDGKMPAGNDLAQILLATPANPKAVNGDTGVSGGLDSGLDYLVGQVGLLPIFTGAVTGTGNNSSFNIVGFVPVTVTQSDGSGSNWSAKFQPRVVAAGDLIPKSGGVQSIEFDVATVADTNEIDVRFLGKVLLCQ